ncbi:MAG: DUF898 family protein [Oenococcus oeni]
MESKKGRKSFFDGSLLEFIGYKILGILVTGCTLGICYPWSFTMIYGWQAKHTVTDGHRQSFDGSAAELFGMWIKWLILSIVTIGIYSFWVRIKLLDWRARHTHFIN